MNSFQVFILLELYTLRNFKNVDNFTLINFRHIVINYIKFSSSYDEFLSLLNTSCLSLDKELCRQLLLFKDYIRFVDKVWDGNL